jgi:type VI secretion system secreted protein VgrG
MTKRFQFSTSSHEDDKLSVVSFTGIERINAPFTFDLRVRAAALDLEQSLIGESAVLMLNGANGSRTVAGVVFEVRLEEMLRDGALYRIELTPWLRTLELRVDTRIFQDMTAPDIVREVLDAHHIDQKWSTRRSYPERPYCVQHQESDLAFVERLLAEEGIFYSVQSAPKGDAYREVIVFGDDTSAYEPIDGPTRIEFHEPDGLVEAHEHIDAFSWGRRFRTGATELTGFDFRRPTVRLNAIHKERKALSTALESYEHERAWNAHHISTDHARVRLEQHRGGAAAGEGKSRCGRLTCGRYFELDAHRRADLNGQLAVVQVSHQGRTPEESSVGIDDASTDEVYLNTFTCIRADDVPRPLPLKPRVQQIVETATVVGPPGEEIFTDEHGRVKVQFHWDRHGEGDDRSSCWLRTLEPWAGAAWGTQFVPRIGMEVAVSFFGGSTDRPFILGAIYNGMNPPPFKLPEHKTQSGIRTRSTPGGEGSNELRFDDAAGAEQIYLHAQHDYVEVVEHDRMREVRGQESVKVLESRHVDIVEDHIRRVSGNELVTVEKNHVLNVQGCQLIQIAGGGAGIAPEARPEVDADQGGPGDAPPAPEAADPGDAVAITGDAIPFEEGEKELGKVLERAEKRKSAQLIFAAEHLPDELYEEGNAIQQGARKTGEKAVEQYLDSRKLAQQAGTPEMAELAAPLEAEIEETRKEIDEQLEAALEPADEALHPLKTAVVSYLTEADHTALGAQETLEAAKNGQLPKPAEEILGRSGGGGGGEDEFTRPEGGNAAAMNISGKGTITASEEFLIKVGGSSIQLLPGAINIISDVIKISSPEVNIDHGKITVTGTAVGINGGPVNVKGDDITIDGSTVDIDGHPITLN